jgi:hypothetical protein
MPVYNLVPPIVVRWRILCYQKAEITQARDFVRRYMGR